MKTTKILLFLLALFIFNSCSDEEAQNAIYYVKYEVVSENGGNSMKQKVSFTTTDGGTQDVTLGWASKHNYSVSQGPFANGTTVKLSVSHAIFNSLSIYVSKGSEPFVMKAHSEGNNVYGLSYTIDME